MYEEENRAIVNLYALNVYRIETFRDTVSTLVILVIFLGYYWKPVMIVFETSEFSSK